MATPQKLFNDLSAGKFRQAYYFYGPEEYRLIEAQKYLVKAFLPDLQILTNYHKIDGRKTSTADLVTELSNLPMLGERQVFAISDIQSYKPKELERIFKMLTPPDPNRVVVFSSPASKVPKKNTAFFKSISQVTEPVEFKKLTEQTSMSQIQGKLRKEGVEIEPAALTLLTRLIDGNRGALEGEVGKLIDYKGSGQTVTVEDVKTVAAGYEVFNLFQLADQVVAGNTKMALQMISSLIAEGISAAALAALLQQHFLSVYLVKNGKKPVGNRAFLAQSFREQGMKYTNEQLESIIGEIAQLDSDLRRSSLKPEMALQMLAVSLTGERK
jgi:DNA polymerase III delta subunit